MKDLTQCSRCNGSGKVAIPPHLQEILDTVRSQGETTTVQIAQAINARRSLESGVSLNSCTNSLVTLIECGFIERREQRTERGKLFLYNETSSRKTSTEEERRVPIVPAHMRALFPKRREAVKGYYFGIYYEPVELSGERIGCGVAAFSGEHSIVLQAPRLADYFSLFGGPAKHELMEDASRVFGHIGEQLKDPEVRHALLSVDLKDNTSSAQDPLRPPTYRPIALTLTPLAPSYYFSRLYQSCGNSIGEIAVHGLMMSTSLYHESQMETLWRKYCQV